MLHFHFVVNESAENMNFVEVALLNQERDFNLKDTISKNQRAGFPALNL